MIDSHAHLYFDSFDPDRDAVFDRAREAGVEHFVVVGIDLETSRQAAELAARRADVSATAGFHPNDVVSKSEDDWAALEKLLAGGGFVGVGETGLDHYWKKSPHELQLEALQRHLDLALRLDLPVVIHCRDAWPDLLTCLEARPPGSRGVMHCFSAGVAEMRRSLAAGFDVSFAGPLTYPRSADIRKACAAVPADRFHLETDCPFLPPQPHRGERNEPSWLPHLARKAAEVRGEDVAVVQTTTSQNTRRLFHL